LRAGNAVANAVTNAVTNAVSNAPVTASPSPPQPEGHSARTRRRPRRREGQPHRQHPQAPESHSERQGRARRPQQRHGVARTARCSTRTHRGRGRARHGPTRHRHAAPHPRARCAAHPGARRSPACRGFGACVAVRGSLSLVRVRRWGAEVLAAHRADGADPGGDGAVGRQHRRSRGTERSFRRVATASGHLRAVSGSSSSSCNPTNIHLRLDGTPGGAVGAGVGRAL
jgi:hypothetical protein